MARSTLVGLMSVLASILCLTVALVSALLVFRLMRRHANKSTRVHQTGATTRTEPRPPRSGGSQGKRAKFVAAHLGQTNRTCELDSSASQGSSSSSPSSAAGSTATSTAPSSTGGALDEHGRRTGLHHNNKGQQRPHLEPSAGTPFSTLADTAPPGSVANVQHPQNQFGQRTPPAIMARQVHYSSFNSAGATSGAHYKQAGASNLRYGKQNQQQQEQEQDEMASGEACRTGQSDWQSDGIYRVPDTRHQHQWGQHLIGGARFANGAGNCERQSPAAWTDQLYQNSRPAGSSGKFNPDYGVPAPANADSDATNRGQLSGMLKVIPASSSATTTAATGGQARAGSRHTPATISVNGKQLYC